MLNGFKVIDADRHVIEALDMWDRFMEPRFRSRVEVRGPGQSGRFVDGKPVSDADALERPNASAGNQAKYIFAGSPKYQKAYAYALEHDFSPESNLHDMDLEGIDVSVLFPTLGLYMTWREDTDPELAAAMCRAYNDWLADYCSKDPARLKGVCLIPLQDPKLALEELKRAASLGHVGIFWRPNLFQGRKLDSPDYFPIYEAASELGVVVCLHEGARTVLNQAGSEYYSEFGRHVACHPLEQMLACLTLCGDGVLQQFPELKVAHLESGCGWVPFWLERMDEHWHHYSHGRGAATKEPPSFYFKRQCMVSTEAGEEFIDVVAREAGDGKIVLATDYPHPDAADKFPERTIGDLVRQDLPDDLKRKILWDNPAALYGIKEPAVAAAS
jgi:predicted TIM-barrel fold metal-dependent hydrolase